jgi:Flp pilus assembly pilin Flp
VNQLAVALLARLHAEDGQTMVEYGLIITFISLVAIAVLIALGGNVVTPFVSASAAL